MCDDGLALDGTKYKEEFPALLPPGFHERTMASLQAEFVLPFPDSVTRASLLQDMTRVVSRLGQERIEGVIWLDGSFITAKPNPSDIDFLLVIHSDVYDEGTPAQQEAIDALADDDAICDTNFVVLFPIEISDNKNQIDYWTDRFGFSTKDRIPKGIVTITLKGGPDDNDKSNAGSSDEDSAR